jgi:hypothetical protein
MATPEEEYIKAASGKGAAEEAAALKRYADHYGISLAEASVQFNRKQREEEERIRSQPERGL